MIDLPDWLDAPKGLVLGVLRVLWWLAWDVCIETVAWSVGWCWRWGSGGWRGNGREVAAHAHEHLSPHSLPGMGVIGPWPAIAMAQWEYRAAVAAEGSEVLMAWNKSLI